MIDAKLTGRAGHKCAGNVVTSIAWKGKVGRHCMSRASVMMSILKWAEEQGLNKISEAHFAQAVGAKLAEEQQMIMNGQLWGFLAAAVQGAADSIFKGADIMQGLDAWRLLTRYIYQGNDIRLETLRREMKAALANTIPSMQKLEEGIPESEHAITEHQEA